jgi:hypothetical protein
MTITTTFVTVLRRFKYLAEKVMYSNHYINENDLKNIIRKQKVDGIDIKADEA